MPAAPDGGRRAATGWGLVDHAPDAEEVAGTRELLAGRFGEDALWTSPPPPPAPTPTPRIRIPDALADVVSADAAVRRLHAVGRSFADTVALRETGVARTPDLVARPGDEAAAAAVLDWCHDEGLACIPFGGGTSVVGGVTPPAGDAPVVTLQLRGLDRVTDVDPVSGAALVQAGASGPRLESQLRPHGLTMRFFPQSFELSTLGGWIATRAAGHYATGPVHVDDLVESVTAITPAGRWASRRLPGSGAGPSPDRLLIGSEGILGVVTEAWVRVQERPAAKMSAAIRFADFDDAVRALAPRVRTGLQPSNCRVLDPVEALLAGAGDGRTSVLVLGAESPPIAGADVQALVEGRMAAMTALLADLGGEPAAANRPAPDRTAPGGADADADADQAWRRSFLRAPYLRDVMVDAGMVVETFETAMTHDRLVGFIADVRAATQAAVAEVCGDGIVTCRITHAYPDGAAPYLTVIAPGRPAARAAQWGEIKAAAAEAIMAAGGTITHHHAVGRDHRPWYDAQRPEPFAAALSAAKAAVDPRGCLNPGVLVGPAVRRT
ncbi:FAD-binding oxidoreductase [Euzebya sp.]|uniref:FAD-binding oxidoreductase n=1 Tax=Euzebya sp. TaxID=1971409 RepID=UPI0035119154